jgi:hypothetical protein
MKQTAVEWLANEMPLIDWKVPYWKIKLEKAKEMEQEQMIDWYATGQADTVNMYEQHLNKNSNTNE